MKVLIFLLVVHFCYSNAWDHSSLMNWVRKCSIETGFDKKYYDKLEDLIRDPDSKKLFLCVAMSGHMFGEDSKLRKDIIEQVLPDPIKESPSKDEWLDECIVKRSTPEETVFDTFICIEKRIFLILHGRPLNI